MLTVPSSHSGLEPCQLVQALDKGMASDNGLTNYNTILHDLRVVCLAVAIDLNGGKKKKKNIDFDIDEK